MFVPVAQQIRFRTALLPTLVDVLGLTFFIVALHGSWLLGLAVGLADAAAAFAVIGGFDYRSRVLFIRQRR
jgi:NhaP-type Na+/H+ and K+/H+ antiporter